MVKNYCLAKSINNAGWYQFRLWLEYFGKVLGRVTIAVVPNGISQECSSYGTVVKKSLSTRTHVYRCGCELDRDHNRGCNQHPAKRNRYSRAYWNLRARPVKRFWRNDLYFGWSNPARASCFAERRIPR
ncbi:transposase [Spirulina subsalsa FACHB-351]|uniref:Transposase n=1 Tax=Spirulina subsalsa FACHB-351 TaxID=234711 RepID=A0ABT3LBS4_9CYAN|nr:transposase [Spirulina subsalsa]MCW6038962.1 transposase [Spirulina subsalsa FACHB-351]